MSAFVRSVLLACAASCWAGATQGDGEEQTRDAAGRPILHGPLASGVYIGVHIVSSSTGVFAILPTTVIDSIIEAPVCVSTSGRHLTLRDNYLDCDLCIEFADGFLLDNVIVDNVCTGYGTNRADILDW